MTKRWKRTPRCQCNQPIYVHEQNALAAAGPGPFPADVVPVYRCPASTAWHVASPDGLPAEVLSSTGRRLAYELLRHTRVDFIAFRRDILRLDWRTDAKRWQKARRRALVPLVDLGVATIEPDPDRPPEPNILLLADPHAANRVVQVGIEHYVSERGWSPERIRQVFH